MQAPKQPMSHVHLTPIKPGHARHTSSSSSRSRGLLTVAHAQRGPDRGSVAALEAAIAAINKILGTYNRVRQPNGSKGSKQGSSSSAGSGGAAAGGKSGIAGLPASGPSKLISFGAKASSSVPVKVRRTITVAARFGFDQHWTKLTLLASYAVCTAGMP
jgi:hypothetical protein